MKKSRTTPRSLGFLTVCFGAILGLVGGLLPDETKAAFEGRAAGFGLSPTVGWTMVTGVALALFLLVNLIKDHFDVNDKARVSGGGSAPETIRDRVLNDLAERYKRRYNHKLDERYEIPLLIREYSAAARSKRVYDVEQNGKYVGESLQYIVSRFNRDGRLFIVGSAGSGKTGLLLKLALHLIKVAESDASAPIPVIFNLASWSPRYSDFNLWIRDMLIKGYGLSADFAKDVVEKRNIVFLLDGLDELAYGNPPTEAARIRGECISTLDNVLIDGSMSAVICCRRDELFAIDDGFGLTLPFRTAVEVVDLTPTQIDRALLEASETTRDRFAAPHLKAAIDKKVEAGLADILATPFYFTTALQVFDSSKSPSIGDGDLEFTLLNAFIQKKLQVTKRPPRLNDTTTVKWLRWLARSLDEGVTFELSDLQPSHLRRQWLFRLVFCLFCGFVGGGVLGLQSRDVSVGLITGVFYGFVSIFFITTEFVRWTVQPFRHWQTWVLLGMIGMGAAIGGGLIFYGITVWNNATQGIVTTTREQNGQINLLMLGIGAAMLLTGIVVTPILRGILGMVNGVTLKKIETEDFGHWRFGSLARLQSWKDILKAGVEAGIGGAILMTLVWLLFVLVFLVLALSNLVLGSLQLPKSEEVFAAIVLTPVLTLFCALLGFSMGLFLGSFLGVFRACRTTERFVKISWPYQRLRTGIFFRLFQYLVLGWFLLLLNRIPALVSDFSVQALFFGAHLIPFFGLLGLFQTAIVQHSILRFCLWLEGSMPIRYARFLRYATALGVLEEDGGQWRFRHQILQQHFKKSSTK